MHACMYVCMYVCMYACMSHRHPSVSEDNGFVPPRRNITVLCPHMYTYTCNKADDHTQVTMLIVTITE